MEGFRLRRAGGRGYSGAVLIALLFLSACASPGITLFDLEPAEGQQSSTAKLEGGLEIAARYLDTDERVQYLRGRGYESLGLGLRPVPLVTFLLTINNGSKNRVDLDPGSIRLAAGAGPLLSPYNYAHLYMELSRETDRQKILRDLRETTIDTAAVIEPGQSLEKLLLFQRPEMVGEEVSLLFANLYIEGKEQKAVLSFRAVDLEQ